MRRRLDVQIHLRPGRSLVACILGPVPAHAAGFSIFEQGARGMGFAGAFTAQAGDPSAIFHNAAGIAFLKGQAALLSVGPSSLPPRTSRAPIRSPGPG